MSGAISISGKGMSVEEVFDFIYEDKEYYDASGGGVTISGGEPLLQIDFVQELAKKCVENGISVYIDTAFCVDFEKILKVLPYTSKFLVDIKANCEEDYKKYTEGSLNLVLQNTKKVIEMGADVLVRIPIIPEHNDSDEYLEKCAQLVESIGVKKVELLPFHRLGTSKYDALGVNYYYKDTKSYTKKDLIKFNKIFINKGVEVL